MNRKTYYPTRTFDDALAGLVQLAQDSKWSFSGVDLKQLAKDVSEQRAERSAHDAVEAKFSHVHETFGVNQQERYLRFATLLEAARGAFGRDKAVMAQLEKFKRSVRRAPRSDAGETPPTGNGSGNGNGHGSSTVPPASVQ